LRAVAGNALGRGMVILLLLACGMDLSSMLPVRAGRKFELPFGLLFMYSENHATVNI
jgi:hypothetical protein